MPRPPLASLPCLPTAASRMMRNDATRVLTTCHPSSAGQPAVRINELTNGLHLARVEHVPVCSDHLEPCTSRRLPSREIDCSQLSGTALAIYFESDNDLGLHRCVRLEARTSMCSCLGKQVVVAIAVDRRVLGVPLPHCPDRTAAGQSGASSVSFLPGGRCSSAALAPQALGPIS